MAIGRSEKIYRAVVLNVASGLRGDGEHKLAKRLELASPEGENKVMEVLTIIERTPGLSADSHRLVAMGKKVINGDLTLGKELGLLSDYMVGAGVELPKDLPN